MKTGETLGQNRLGYIQGKVFLLDSEFWSDTMSPSKERLQQILCERSITTGEFTLASGQKSNYYIDAKPTTLDPEGLSLTAIAFWEKLNSLPVFPKAIGGKASGAIPIVAAIVELSFRQGGTPVYGFYVREERKSHGTEKRIEGYEGSPGDPVVIVDDVCTKGKSAIDAIMQAKERGWCVVAAIFLVNREEGGNEAIEQHCPFHAIFTARELLAALEETSLRGRTS